MCEKVLWKSGMFDMTLNVFCWQHDHSSSFYIFLTGNPSNGVPIGFGWDCGSIKDPNFGNIERNQLQKLTWSLVYSFHCVCGRFLPISASCTREMPKSSEVPHRHKTSGKCFQFISLYTPELRVLILYYHDTIQTLTWFNNIIHTVEVLKSKGLHSACF